MKNRLPLLPLTALFLAALACNISLDTGMPLSQEQIDTLSAQTLQVIQWQTLSASGGTPAIPPQADTLAPPPADTATNTLLPSVTPTGTLQPSVTKTPLPCNRAKFIIDVTILDNWETSPSDHFTKTWRLQNAGSCTWTSGYSLIFDSGDQMGAPDSQQLTPGTVAPGGTIDVSVDLLSPNIAGTYQGFFKLRSSEGQVFGIGENANEAFWVKIKVIPVLAPPVVAPMTQSKYEQVVVAAGDIGTTTAVCESGTVVTGGGFSSGTSLRVYTQLKNGNGWQVYAKNLSASNKTLTVYAICLTYPSASTTQVHESLTVAAGSQGSKTKDCPSGSVVTGGGFTGKIDGSLWTFYSSLDGNGWEVSAKNTGAGSVTYNTYAVCLSGTPLSTSNLTGYTDIAPSTNGYAEIGCPAGKVITGGGWNLENDLMVYYASWYSGKWRVYAKNTGTHTRALQARGVCLSV